MTIEIEPEDTFYLIVSCDDGTCTEDPYEGRLDMHLRYAMTYLEEAFGWSFVTNAGLDRILAFCPVHTRLRRIAREISLTLKQPDNP